MLTCTNQKNVYMNELIIYDDVDTNECEEGHADCSPHATCTNTEGSFTCTCKPGYIGNGHICHRKSH